MLEKYQKNITAGLKKVRLERGMSQAELADQLEISRSRFSEIESGKGSISAEQFVLLMQIFGLSVDYFFPDQTENSTQQLQNALFRLGATYLIDDNKLIPSEKMLDINTVVVEALLSAQARFITALAPVIVRQLTFIYLEKIVEKLKRIGPETRLWWVVEATYHALTQRLLAYLPQETLKRYRKAVWTLDQARKMSLFYFEAHWSSYPHDILDKSITSKRAFEQVRTTRDELASRWRIITRIKQEDFLNVLIASEQDGKSIKRN